MLRLKLPVAVLAGSILGMVLIASQAFAADPWVSIGDGATDTGAKVSVNLTASDIGDPGLGAWSIDIMYDPDVVTAVDCENGPDQIAVCNPDYRDDTVRVAGASAGGITGDIQLAEITFRCGDSVGDTALTIDLPDFSDATPGDLQTIDAATNNGSISCGVALPATGSHGSSDSGMLMALMGILAAVGLAAVGRFALVQRSI